MTTQRQERLLSSCRLHRLLQQIRLHEHDCRIELKVLILLLRESMALVLRFEIPKRSTVALQLVSHLARLAHRNSRIVCTCDYKCRLGDLRRVIHRRDAFHELTHLWIALITVLNTTKVASIWFGVLK